MIRRVVFHPTTGLTEVEDSDSVREALADPESRVWVDVEGRSDESDALFREVFNFHELAIEDVYKERHRPKVEDYDRYLYLILRGLRDTSELGEVHTTEIDLFVGKSFIVTHHQRPMPGVTTVFERLRTKADLLERGPVFVAHAIVDRIVDGFLELDDQFGLEVDRIEEAVLAGEDELARIVEVRGSLHALRRMALAQQNVLAKLARAEFDEIPAEAKPFFRDVHEHMVQFVENLELERDELNAVFDAFHSLSAHRMNEIMKVLTLISTIMLPLTFLAGVYGMNFKHMPELDYRYAYYVCWAAMIAIGVTMTLYFKKRGWL